MVQIVVGETLLEAKVDSGLLLDEDASKNMLTSI